MSEAQLAVDERNAEFWNELCGTALAQSVGVNDASAESLARFDAAYLDMYPYLERYLPDDLAGARVLEIGLGYGTLGQLMAKAGADYHGLDIAEGPVAMMNHRLRLMGFDDANLRVVRGSALELPYEPSSFRYVVSIGCLHHTGNVERAVSEVRRVLVPGGTAIVMLYNARSLRRLALATRRGVGLGPSAQENRARYDANSGGDPAPVTEFFSRRQATRFFAEFSSVRIRSENIGDVNLVRGRIRLRRQWFLGNLSRVAGLDLYIVATR
jgi:SAM-dependent methyltransferase